MKKLKKLFTKIKAKISYYRELWEYITNEKNY